MFTDSMQSIPVKISVVSSAKMEKSNVRSIHNAKRPTTTKTMLKNKQKPQQGWKTHIFWVQNFLQNYSNQNGTSIKVKVKVTQSCPTLWGPMDYTVQGILQARILEWVAFPFSRGSSQPRDQTQVSCTAGGLFTSWATREALV